MAGRGPGLAGIVSRPTISSYDRSSLSPGMRSLFDGLDKAGFGDISVNSGYRSPVANAKARGAKSSQHLSGNAADFNFGGQPNERKAAFVDAARGLNANGLGFYGQGDSIHLDTRAGPRVAWGVNGSYRRADPNAFPSFIQPNVSAFYGQRPVTQPATPIAGPVNAFAPEDPAAAPGSIRATNGLAGRSRMPNAAQSRASSFPSAPSVPGAPAQPGLFSQGGFFDRNSGLAVGGLLGTAALGPVGGLVGGLLGHLASEGTKGRMSDQAKSAMTAGWDGFSGQPGSTVASPAPSVDGPLGSPSIPAAPSQPGMFAAGGMVDRNKGGLLGGLLGTAALGPAGGLLGGIVGNAISNGSKGALSSGARAALNVGWDGVSGMTSAQAAAAAGRATQSRGSGGRGTPSAAASAAMGAGWDGVSGMSSAQASAARNAGSGASSGGSGSYGSSPNRSGQNGNLSGGSKSSSSSSSKSGSSGGKKK